MTMKKTTTQRIAIDGGELVFAQQKRHTIIYMKKGDDTVRTLIPHVEMGRLLNSVKKDIATARSQHITALRNRDKYRGTLCSGCRHNYYNYPKGQSPNGDVAVSEDYYCWSIPEVKRGKCTAHSG